MRPWPHCTRAEQVRYDRHYCAITHILHLFVHVSNLEPDIDIGQRSRRVPVYTIKALQACQIAAEDPTLSTHLEALLVFLLLLVDYAETEKDLVGLVKVLVHAQDTRKCFLGMFKRPITVVQDADAVPKFRVLKLFIECEPCYAWISN